jgi:3-deoxy-D-manno-octulosonic-acid transferase
MSSLFYSLGIFFYHSAIFLAAFFNPKARLWIKGRKNIMLKFSLLQKDLSPKAWFHVASLGEFEQARPLMEAYRKLHPERKIVLTFFSPSGFEVRKNYPGANYILYLPLDTRRNATRLVHFINPVEVFFVKYEFWFHILTEIQRKKIPLYLVSGIFRENQLFFKFYGSWFLKVLSQFNHLFVQNTSSLSLLNRHGISQCTLAGDTRFDRVAELIATAKKLPEIEEFKQQSNLIIAGSSWPSEEEFLAAYLPSIPQNWKLIIAPHEVSPEHCAEIQNRFANQSIRFSEILSGKPAANFKVLIIDNMGMLTSIYSYGSIAVVGGGFKTGLHNVLEPAAYGMPVVFGPYYSKFDEAKGLLDSKGGISVSNQNDFFKSMDQLITRESVRKEMANNAHDFVQLNKGAVEKILSHLNPSSQAC